MVAAYDKWDNFCNYVWSYLMIYRIIYSREWVVNKMLEINRIDEATQKRDP